MLIIVFFIGSAVGSFLNVVVDRGNNKETFLAGRSHCEYCKKHLQIADLIPVLSFIFLRGKCRYCKKKLSFYYPLVEIITGIMFVIIVVTLFPYFPIGITSPTQIYLLFTTLVIVSSLILIFFTDLKFGIIPIMPVVIALVASLAIHLLSAADNVPLINFLLSGFFLASFFLSIFLVTRGRGMGFGDVIYAFLMGFILGYPKVILGFYIAVLSGSIIPIMVLTIQKKKIRGTVIPFGPFLVAGTIISLFWGDLLINAILSYLLR